MSELDIRVTELVQPSDDGYALVSGAEFEDAVDKLGVIEDLIESGELMPPDIKPGDTIYFVFKSSVVLEGTLANVYSGYDETEGKYYYYVVLENDFYGSTVHCPASYYNKTWFKTQAAAEAALQEILEAEEEENVGNDPE